MRTIVPIPHFLSHLTLFSWLNFNPNPLPVEIQEAGILTVLVQQWPELENTKFRILEVEVADDGAR